MIQSLRLFYASLIMLLVGLGQFLVIWEVLLPDSRDFNFATGFLMSLAVGQILLAAVGLVFSFKRRG